MGVPDYNSTHPLKNGAIWTESFFNDSCNLAKYLISTGYTNDAMNSITFIPSPSSLDEVICLKPECVYNITHNFTVNAACESIHNSDSLALPDGSFAFSSAIKLGESNEQLYLDMFMDLYSQTVDENETATLIQLTVDFNPFGVDITHDLRKLRDHINDNFVDYGGSKPDDGGKGNPPHSTWYIHNSMYWTLDAMDQTYEDMPWLLAGICGVAFVLIGVAFRAVFLPIRLFFVIAIPILFTYGLATG